MRLTTALLVLLLTLIASPASDAPITRNAESPIGVIGRVSPWANEALRCTRRPGCRGGGTGYSVVIARDWVSQSVLSPSSAHSMSCGAP